MNKETLTATLMKHYHENMIVFFEDLSLYIDGEQSDIDDDTPLKDLPLAINDDDRPFNVMLAKARLKGESIYDIDFKPIEDILIKKSDEGSEFFNREYTQGKLVMIGEVLESLGKSLEGAVAKRWGYWSPYN